MNRTKPMNETERNLWTKQNETYERNRTKQNETERNRTKPMNETERNRYRNLWTKQNETGTFKIFKIFNFFGEKCLHTKNETYKGRAHFTPRPGPYGGLNTFFCPFFPMYWGVGRYAIFWLRGGHFIRRNMRRKCWRFAAEMTLKLTIRRAYIMSGSMTYY